ncbi:ABC transporter ATP-binding protein [Faecalibacter sp. LW9]|uniref:ABC transporter ATP-binding protein n=1 Tax=Faecalibacter sp. LW9 TaxID=3103144 RepID=UPI002AFE9532|nr:ABC transporter ATP-binding protein [Faecalibacter sp. LW9]
MEKEILVKVENVSKKFTTDLKDSLKYGFGDIVKSLFGKQASNELRKNEFWAVKGVSFELRRGECIGLIGHNGAGKSTLLKILNGLYAPDKGKVTMKGKVGALIELGAGFNPILTGRENIYNNAAILGFTKQEVNDKMQSIIDFCEIEEFLDMPVKNYSSGMRVRLGFAVASHLDPDVLIIDEVLAVGDMSFSLKCFKKIDEILPNTAVIFVSHNLTQISRICNQVILLKKGQVLYQGNNVSEGIQKYFETNNTNNITETQVILPTVDFEINNVKFNGEATKEFTINWDEEIIVSFDFLNKNLDKMPYFVIQIFDKEQKPLLSTSYDHIGHLVKNELYKIEISLSKIDLTAGQYFINLGVLGGFEKDNLYKINNLGKFTLVNNYISYSPILRKIAPKITHNDSEIL